MFLQTYSQQAQCTINKIMKLAKRVCSNQNIYIKKLEADKINQLQMSVYFSLFRAVISVKKKNPLKKSKQTKKW